MTTTLLDYLNAKGTGSAVHPLVRLVRRRREADDVPQLVIERDRIALGFEPARIRLIFPVQDRIYEEQWSADLNQALIVEEIKAVDAENESVRLTLALESAFESVRVRFGEGFFSSVLVRVVRESPFASLPRFVEILPNCPVNTIDDDDRSYDDCRAMILEILRERLGELTDVLNYGQAAAESILADALAEYLDERFTVTDRRRMGWL